MCFEIEETVKFMKMQRIKKLSRNALQAFKKGNRVTRFRKRRSRSVSAPAGYEKESI